MNKIIVVICIFTIAFISFTVGYKYGDSNGYDAGYKEGYRYDCKAEISELYSVVKEQKKAVEFVEKRVNNLSRENDSLKHPGVYDSMRVRFARDSVKYYKVSRRKNDSLRTVTGSSINNIILDNGKVNSVACLIDSKLKDLPECKPGWRVDK